MIISNEKGWIAELGEEYNHQFGGNSWIINDSNEIAGGPTLILNLDLTDPRLNHILDTKLTSLPICSYINCDVWGEPQYFKISSNLKEVFLIKRSNFFTTIFQGADKFPNPLPMKSLKLREMKEVEITKGKENYWDACDTFVGGKSFIRVLGQPIWLQKKQRMFCLCENEQKYICSIGYDYAQPTGIIDNGSFFIGEAALYFFFCSECLILSVMSQSA